MRVDCTSFVAFYSRILTNGADIPTSTSTAIATASGSWTSTWTPTTSKRPSNTPSPTSTVSASNTRDILPETADFEELEFESSADWDIPEEAAFLDVFLVGGGGGGGRRGGGGGGYTKTFVVDVRDKKLNKVSLVVGEGGTGRDGNGDTGGTTEFNIQ